MQTSIKQISHNKKIIKDETNHLSHEIFNKPLSELKIFTESDFCKLKKVINESTTVAYIYNFFTQESEQTGNIQLKHIWCDIESREAGWLWSHHKTNIDSVLKNRAILKLKELINNAYWQPEDITSTAITLIGKENPKQFHPNSSELVTFTIIPNETGLNL